MIRGVPLIADPAAHAAYLHGFSTQFWMGELYPRWLPVANKGYGSPFFLIQYPLPFWITALLRPVVAAAPDAARESREIGVYMFLALAAAGVSSRYWLRKLHRPLAATGAGIVYMTLPYLIALVVYNDGAIGQLTAIACMPLSLAACHAPERRIGSAAPLALAWALLVVSNALNAVLLLPILVVYACVCGESRHQSLLRNVVWVLCAIGLGGCIAAVYLLPFAVYRHLFDFKTLAAHLPGMEVSKNFVFVDVGHLERRIVSGLVGALALGAVAAAATSRLTREYRYVKLAILLTLVAGVVMMIPGLGPSVAVLGGLSSSTHRNSDFYPARALVGSMATVALAGFAFCQLPNPRRYEPRNLVLLATGLVAFIFMLPVSAVVWRTAPTIAAMIQFPTRFGALLGISTVGLVAGALDMDATLGPKERGQSTLSVIAFALAVILIGAGAFGTDRKWMGVLRHPDFYDFRLDTTREVDQWFRSYVKPEHLAAFAGLIGAEVDGYGVRPAPPHELSARLLRGHGTVAVASPVARSLVISYSVEDAAVAEISQVYFPLWRFTTFLDRDTELHSSPTGLIAVWLPRGSNQVTLSFDLGWPERLGVTLTVVSLAAVLGGALIGGWFSRRRRREPMHTDAAASDHAPINRR
jgi:hypothetical protein